MPRPAPRLAPVTTATRALNFFLLGMARLRGLIWPGLLHICRAINGYDSAWHLVSIGPVSDEWSWSREMPLFQVGGPTMGRLEPGLCRNHVLSARSIKPDRTER